MIPLPTDDDEQELSLYKKYGTPTVLHRQIDSSHGLSISRSKIQYYTDLTHVGSQELLLCDAIEEDATKLLTHAFEHKTNYQHLKTNIMSNNRISGNSIDRQTGSNRNPCITQKNMMIKSIDNKENQHYILPIAELSKTHHKSTMLFNLPKCCGDTSISEHTIWCDLNRINCEPTEFCDICSNKPHNCIDYNKWKKIGCCRLNIFHSLAYVLGGDDCKLLLNGNGYEENSCVPTKSILDSLILKGCEWTISSSTPNEKPFKDKCKMIWRDYYHRINTSCDNATLCDSIEKKITLCKLLLNHLISVIGNIFKIIPDTKVPTRPAYDNNTNPICYTKYCPLNKLYAKFMCVFVDIDYIVASMDKNFLTMLPTFLGSKFSTWMQTLTDFNLFMKKYSTSQGNNHNNTKDINSNGVYNEIDSSSKNFHYCKHFSTIQQLQDLSLYIDAIYNNLLFGPFILNFCIMVCRKKMPKRQLGDVGFDQDLIPSYIWDHPFISLVHDIDSVIKSLTPHHIDR